MDYYLFFKNSNTKAPITGLTPAWSSLIKASDGTAFTPQPAFTEIGAGYYKFTLAATQDLIGRVDGGAALAVQDRYIEVTLSAGDAYLDAAVSSRSTLAAGAAMTLTAAYDAAKTAAQPGDVTAAQSAILAAVPAAPDNTGIASALAILQDATVGLARLDTELDTVATILGGVALNSDIQTLLGRISGAVPQLAAIVSGILDAAAADHNVAGTIGEKISRDVSTVVIPLVPALPTTVNLTRTTVVNLKRGDTPRLTFSLGFDCTGWTPFFGAKKSPGQTAFDMALREVAYSNQAAGTGYVDLSATDTATVGTFTGEIEIQKDDKRSTPQTYTFKISDDIIK